MKHRSISTGLLVSVIALAGCITPTVFNPSLHPSLAGDSNSAGVSLGGVYYTGNSSSVVSSSTSAFEMPYGEGWVRFGVGGGQLELRATPSLGSVGYRVNILSAQDNAVGLAVKPALGVAYMHGSDATLGSGSGNNSDALLLAPNITLLLCFAHGSVYFAPRLGYWYLNQFDSSPTDGAVGVGANLGYIIHSKPFDYSLEVAFQRAWDTKDPSSPIYSVVPSLGIQL